MFAYWYGAMLCNVTATYTHNITLIFKSEPGDRVGASSYIRMWIKDLHIWVNLL
jgi:hypothetical protein